MKKRTINVKKTILKVLKIVTAPACRFLGHSLGFALMYAGLALVSQIPLAVIKVVSVFGFKDALLTIGLISVSDWMVYADVILFKLCLVLSAIQFVFEVSMHFLKDIKANFEE